MAADEDIPEDGPGEGGPVRPDPPSPGQDAEGPRDRWVVVLDSGIELEYDRQGAP
jgi:hypothetical protein